MYKKFRLFYFLVLCVPLFISIEGFTQVKKTVPKKPIIAAKPIAKKITAKVKPAPVRIKISTDSGVIIVKLSDSTPLHRDNFVKLVKAGFYDSLLFHRVIQQFMIQGGDPGSKYAAPNNMLGNGGGDMTRIPAEFHSTLFHKKGALAAARDGNPEMASSACQFYLVEGKTYTDEQLNMLEQQKGRKYTIEQRNIYKTSGGTPHLDQAYTVFGEVETGIEVIAKIAYVKKDDNNRPAGDVRMRMEIIK